ncbi:hypothetical protein NP511_22605 (plasmid) [Natrinema thermotolerans]|uniref:Uncharacterized protein n=1 Tax=Natrinema thermotolerans TaxID=121872 RepID=A0AAF0PJ09_9EURY|nr:hypothetical protein [Natrinema thermotolerans]QCC57302.1 hypothetical protein DVR14_01080 [Natrinema thermotolerans]WMT10359.1 hypothetical protein NP511_22605 [Natrinema thermotolerans]
MRSNCIACGSPTKSHHIATTDGVEQFCCHSCWQHRDDDDIQEALREYNVLTGERLDELRETFRSFDPVDDLEVSFSDLPVGQGHEIRRGAGGEIFELAGAEQVGKGVIFDGPFAGVTNEVDLPRDPEEPIYAAFGFTPSGDDHEPAYLAWLCIGDDGDALSTAVDSLAAAMRGEPDV